MDGPERGDFEANTYAFDEWKDVDSDLRAFVDLTTKWMGERFQQVWDEVGREPWYDGAPDQIDAFYRAVGGIEPVDYDWMLQALVIRDAVSAYEVYLEKAGHEVLRRHRLAWRSGPGRTPPWRDVVAFYGGKLGVDVETSRIKEIRELRHLMTHVRGELRTERQRIDFGRQSERGGSGYRAELGIETVMAVLDDLASSVHAIDRVAWRYAFGSGRLPTP